MEYDDIEYNDFAKNEAMKDIEEYNLNILKRDAIIFYNELQVLSIEEIKQNIKNKIFSKDSFIILLDNLISIFEMQEEYEKCKYCLQIKETIK